MHALVLWTSLYRNLAVSQGMFFVLSRELVSPLPCFQNGARVLSCWISLPQAKGRRERERERKRKGKEKGKGKIGSEALAETENIAHAPAGKRTRDPSKRGWSSTIEPPRQATSQTSLFEILSVLPHLHNIRIIQCSQLTNPLRSEDPTRVAIVNRARTEGTVK